MVRGVPLDGSRNGSSGVNGGCDSTVKLWGEFAPAGRPPNATNRPLVAIDSAAPETSPSAPEAALALPAAKRDAVRDELLAGQG
jgi:hypothetical protein